MQIKNRRKSTNILDRRGEDRKQSFMMGTMKALSREIHQDLATKAAKSPDNLGNVSTKADMETGKVSKANIQKLGNAAKKLSGPKVLLKIPLPWRKKPLKIVKDW